MDVSMKYDELCVCDLFINEISNLFGIRLKL